MIQSFVNGLDLRRSHDTAPPGSLRVLRNCYVTPGGEIQKRKAFIRSTVWSNYAQSTNYRGRVTGPHRCEGSDNAIYFRHRHNSLPSGGGWLTTGLGSFSTYRLLTSRPETYAWAMLSVAPASSAFGALLRTAFWGAYAGETHLVESYYATSSTTADHQHIVVLHGPDGEPLSEALVPANNNRDVGLILRAKAYLSDGKTVYASATNDPENMGGTGSGALDTRTQSFPIGRVMALAEYFGQLVIMGTRGAQFWQVDPDFTKNQYLRTIPLTTVATRAAIGYGDGDVVYLAKDGVRSLRARDSSNIAGVSDIGSPIDPLIQAELDPPSATIETTAGISQKNEDWYRLAIMRIHPETGHLWLCLKNKVYVYAYHPDAKVRAWSTFDLPAPISPSATQGAEKAGWVADICELNDDLIFRTFNDEVFFYGGGVGSRYDTSEAEIVTPHMDMGLPGTTKFLRGVDLACQGTWTVEVSLDPANIVWETIATVTNSTFRLTGKIPIDAECTHVALRLTSTSASAARVGQVTLYYEQGSAK